VRGLFILNDSCGPTGILKHVSEAFLGQRRPASRRWLVALGAAALASQNGKAHQQIQTSKKE
jgi:hypothetical protein